jgi:photosystem II stability/assembly factor-like uncharacterized protein
MFRPEDLLQDEIEYPDQTRQLQQNYAPSQADQRSLLRIRMRLLEQRSTSLPPALPIEEMQTAPLQAWFNETLEHPLAGQFLPPRMPQPSQSKKKLGNAWRLVALVAVLSVIILSGIWYTLLHFSAQTGYPDQPRVTPTTVPGQNTSLSGLSEIKMTSATIGWAREDLSSGQLPTIARTTDGGKSWRAFDFHGQTAGLVGHFFLNDQTAWVIMGTSLDAHTNVTVMRTTDGGQHWTTLQLPPEMANITFLDQQHGWAWARGPLAGVQASRTLYKTVDGGATWSNVSTLSTTRTFEDLTPGPLPLSDSLNLNENLDLTFLTSDRGWAIVYQSSQTSDRAFLYLTQNSGVTWQLQQLPQPATGPIPGIHTTIQGNNLSGAFVTVGAPQFFTVYDGILSVTVQLSAQTQREVYLYATTDGGQNWSSLGTNIEGTGTSRVFVLDAAHLLLVDAQTITVYVLVQDRWQEQGSSQVVGAKYLSFVNSQLGWTYTEQQSGDQIMSTLYTTSDGGKSWQKIGQNITTRSPSTQGG